MIKRDAKFIMKVIREETTPTSARLQWVELRLSELFRLDTKGILNATQMRRENTRRLKQRYLLTKCSSKYSKCCVSDEDMYRIMREGCS